MRTIEQDECNCFMTVLRKYLEHVSAPTIFIETGTCDGCTTIAAAKYFDQVITVENNIDPARAAIYEKIQTDNPGHITIIKDTSAEFLGKLLPTMSKQLCFLLDAHNSYNSPLKQELEAICAHSSRKDHVIMIDDTVDCGHGNWPTYDQMIALLKAINPNYTIIQTSIGRNVVIAFP